MIISNSQIQGLLTQYSKQNVKVSNKNQDIKPMPGKSVDQVNVSKNAQAYMTARQAINNVPDIREERLIEIEQRVQSGTYEVKDEDIAEKMIGRTLVDKLV